MKSETEEQFFDDIFCNAHFWYKGNLGFWLGRIKTHDLVLIIEVPQRHFAQARIQQFRKL